MIDSLINGYLDLKKNSDKWKLKFLFFDQFDFQFLGVPLRVRLAPGFRPTDWLRHPPHPSRGLLLLRMLKYRIDVLNLPS